MFRAIASDDFPPFGKFHLSLPAVADKPATLAEVHLLTGVNGSGKTRILSVLAGMLGHAGHITRRQKGNRDGSRFVVSNRGSNPDGQPIWNGAYRGHHSGSAWETGDFSTWATEVPAFAYSGTAYVNDADIAVMDAVPRPPRDVCLSFARPETHSKQLLQAIANLKVQAALDSMNEAANQRSPSHPTQLIQILETAISEVTAQAFAFQVSGYPKPGLGVRWGAGTFPFDLLPDGLRSIIGWLGHAVVMMDAWLQGKGGPNDTEAVFLLDEIESHLHPAWQRRILPAFQRLFPKSQIFIATHSPFVIASLNHGWIHRFSIDSLGRVANKKPLQASEGDSYVSVVEDIMGVQEWYDPETEKLLADFRAKRDAAYKGDSTAKAAARDLAGLIGKRSLELDYMMGRELSQMDRQLAKPVPAQ